jgi:hypothetical protein
VSITQQTFAGITDSHNENALCIFIESASMPNLDLAICTCDEGSSVIIGDHSHACMMKLKALDLTQEARTLTEMTTTSR